jgi:1-acyl-sn-glycerol-3-phosphate acyltransferase
VQLIALFAFGTLQLIIKRPATYGQRADWLHQFAGRLLRATHITWRVDGIFPESGVVISNHLGYLDIMVFAAQHRCVFVSKAELADVPLLGWMTTMSGTVYVARGSGGSAVRARSGLQAAAEAGVPVVIFPEGTTSDGSGLLDFRSGLLAQVLEAGQSVTAAHVRYSLTEDNGPDVSVENDVAFWGDDAHLFRHIFRLLTLRGIEVNIRIAEKPIEFVATFHERKQAAVEARAAVMELAGLKEPVLTES